MMYPTSPGQVNKKKVLYVQDTSTNGTFVNNKRVKKGGYQLLEEGDVVDFLPPGDKNKNEARVAFKLTYASAEALSARSAAVEKAKKAKAAAKEGEDDGPGGPMVRFLFSTV